VKSHKKQYIDIEIDKLTDSITNVISGDSFDTIIERITKSDLKLLKKGWNFDWIMENSVSEVYKLTIINNPEVIQGLIGLIDKKSHIYISLIESADFNIGRNKIYEGVAGNLFAFACKCSFDKGYEGLVSFTAKSNLIPHYEKTLNAKRIGSSQSMVIETRRAIQLVNQYYKS